MPNERPVFAAMEADHNEKQQPGGNLQIVVGRATGRIQEKGSDKWGRYCWQALRGGRDEGVVFITAHRVCQDSPDKAGPHKAYTRDFLAMREEGVKRPNPRRRILADLVDLIKSTEVKGSGRY